MRSALLLSPLALLTSACALEPSVSPATAAAPAPWAPAIAVPSAEQVHRRWQLTSADPWAPFAKYTLLASLGAPHVPAGPADVLSLEPVRRAQGAARAIAAAGLPRDTLWVVDMRGAASVAFGAALSHAAREAVSVVPTFNHWPAERGFIPAEETLAAMTALAPKLAEDEAGGRPVFLLDSWRLAYRFEDPGDETYDNRYMLSPSDLPDSAMLRAHGIGRIVYLVQSLDGTAVEEDDVHARFLEWSRAGIQIAIVDLDRMERPLVADRWDDVWRDADFVVQPRVTVLEQPWFYEQARGAFGGPDALPSSDGLDWDRAWSWGGAGRSSGHGGHGGGG